MPCCVWFLDLVWKKGTSAKASVGAGGVWCQRCSSSAGRLTGGAARSRGGGGRPCQGLELVPLHAAGQAGLEEQLLLSLSAGAAGTACLSVCLGECSTHKPSSSSSQCDLRGSTGGAGSRELLGLRCQRGSCQAQLGSLPLRGCTMLCPRENLEP